MTKALGFEKFIPLVDQLLQNSPVRATRGSVKKLTSRDEGKSPEGSTYVKLQRESTSAHGSNRRPVRAEEQGADVGL